MNNEKNKKIWIERVHTNLTLRNRSETTYCNYKSAILRFLNFYDEKTIIKKLKEKDILIYLKKDYQLSYLKTFFLTSLIMKIT